MLAKSVASLDVLSGGRTELGLGAGAFWEAIVAMGGPPRTPKESVDALAEAIEIIRPAWASDGRGISFEGEHYAIKGARLGPAPAHPVELWLGAYKPRMLRLTGAQGRRLAAEHGLSRPGPPAGDAGPDRRRGARRRARPGERPPPGQPLRRLPRRRARRAACRAQPRPRHERVPASRRRRRVDPALRAGDRARRARGGARGRARRQRRLRRPAPPRTPPSPSARPPTTAAASARSAPGTRTRARAARRRRPASATPRSSRPPAAT